MSYTSISFAAFVAVTLAVYFIFPFARYKWVVLLAASYFFYAGAGVQGFFFILFTTATTYLTGLAMERIAAAAAGVLQQKKGEWSREEKKQYKKKIEKKKKWLLAAALLANFGILLFLKYGSFIFAGIDALLQKAGIAFSFSTIRLLMPLGISFYTFQSMGYLIDVYRGSVKAEKNPAKIALFVSFFPQIIQGPISFYDQLAGQLYEPHRFDFTRCKYGLELILWGLFKKMVIADRAVTAIQDVCADYAAFSGTTILFTVLLYALQLYADFSAGIDISRGIAQILGIDMVQNFKRPYFAKDINDYWRRWHITLGAWMKNYLFYPLAMSPAFTGMGKWMKKSKFGATAAGSHIAKVLPTSIASFIVFLVVGIWHGSNWKYVGFGIWNGGIIMLSTLCKPLYDGIKEKLHIPPGAAWYDVFQMLRTFLVVLVGYMFDIAPDFFGALDMMRRIVTDWSLSASIMELSKVLTLRKGDYVVLLAGALLIFIVSVIQERHPQQSLRVMLDSKPFLLRWCLVFLGIVSVLVFGVYGPGYDPAGFVYMQF